MPSAPRSADRAIPVRPAPASIPLAGTRVAGDPLSRTAASRILRPVNPRRRRRSPLASARHRALALALAALLLAPASARGALLDADRIGGIEIGSPAAGPGLRAVAPDVGMAAGILVTGDGRELWSRFSDDERAMASITKVMTAVVALEHTKPDDKMRIETRATRVGESEAGLVAGRTYAVRKVLEALLVKSGNDAAEALALHVAGSEKAFVDLMNAKAAALGMTHTHFVNAHGLDAPGHRTSAADLATLCRYAMGDAEFRRIVALDKATIPGPKGTVITMENSNKLIASYAGATGVKTGWTDDAGYCVATSAERGGVTLYAIVLGAQSETTRFSYARRLLDWGFEHYRPRRLATTGDDRGAVPVTDYLDVTVPLMTAVTTDVPVFDLEGTVTVTADVATEVEAPVVRGQRLGTLTAVQGDRLLARIAIVAASDVEEPGFWERIGIWFTRVWRRVFGGQRVAPARVVPAALGTP
ncbi:MAG: D-alanyl-D-alanine carboxypeptidase [Actinobacteria bacterium]|nr:MAG: D-alanyl-D-alanine carboxypeptidase [Actinomycetota bacterium]